MFLLPDRSSVSFTVSVTTPVVKLFAVISNADNKVFTSKRFFSNKAQLSNIKRFGDCNSYIKERAFFYARKFCNISRSFVFKYTKVYVVQKTKKTKGIVEKLNKTRALVKIVAEESWDNGWVRNSVYSIPYSMLESA